MEAPQKKPVTESSPLTGFAGVLL